MRRLILASASPRRCNLLKNLGLNFEVIPSDIEEEVMEGVPPQKVVSLLARKKALSIAQKQKDAVVIGADTIVVYKDNILGKPFDENDAQNMLNKLSGEWHQVITGIAVIDSASGKCKTHSEITHVKFKTISEQEIKDYIKTGEPLDKAGGYGIQGKGGLFVEEIKGCFYNVVGLPLSRLYDVLKDFHIKII